MPAETPAHHQRVKALFFELAELPAGEREERLAALEDSELADDLRSLFEAEATAALSEASEAGLLAPRALRPLPPPRPGDTSPRYPPRPGRPAAYLAAAALLLAALAIGGSLRLQRQLERAERSQRQAEDSLSFFAELFGALDPEVAAGREVGARELLDRGAERLERELAAEPDTRALVTLTLGRTYGRIGDDPSAERLLAAAVATARRLDPPDPRLLGDALHGLGAFYAGLHRFPEAEQALREALAVRRTLPGGALRAAEAADQLAIAVESQGRRDEAEQLYRESIALQEHARGRAGAAYDHLAALYRQQGRVAEAEALLRDVLEHERRRHPGDHPDLAVALANLAAVVDDEAENAAITREALAMRRRLYGADHPQVANTLNTLAQLEFWRGEFGEAQQHLEEARAALGRSPPEGGNIEGVVISSLGRLYADRGELDQARAAFEQALALQRRLEGEGDFDLGPTQAGLGDVLCRQGEHAAGERLLRAGGAIVRAGYPEGHWRIALIDNRLGGCLARQGKIAEARALFAAARPILERRFPPAHPQLQIADANQALAGAGAPR